MGLNERVEQFRLFFRGDAGPVSTTANPAAGVGLMHRSPGAQRDASLLRELERIASRLISTWRSLIGSACVHSAAVRRLARRAAPDPVLRPGRRTCPPARRACTEVEVGSLSVARPASILDRSSTWLISVCRCSPLRRDDAEVFWALARQSRLACRGAQSRERIQRRAQFVAHVGQKGALGGLAASAAWRAAVPLRPAGVQSGRARMPRLVPAHLRTGRRRAVPGCGCRPYGCMPFRTACIAGAADFVQLLRIGCAVIRTG